MFSNLTQGLGQLGNLPSIGYLIAGALIGMLIGVVPGLGGVVVMAVVLAFINHLSLTATLCLFLGTYCGQFFSASISSILLNTPAHPESFAVTFDGFPMAQRGQAGRALGISAASTCIGGVLGCAALVGFIPIINYFPNLFHPPEYVALVSVALILVGTLGAESASKAVLSAGIGLMIASVGPAASTGLFRYTFNATGLDQGVDLVALVLGLFAVPQMLLVFGTGTAVARQDMLGNDVAVAEAQEIQKGFGRQVLGGVAETFKYRWILLQSTVIGVVTGVIPGVGAFAANFLSYGVAQQSSRKRRHLFGTGIPEGIIAPEGSSLSKEAGSMVPLLGLGIPGGVGGAIFLAALDIKGVKTGYGFTVQYPTVAYEIVWIIALSGIIGTIAGVLLAPNLARVTRLPGPLLVPFIMALAVVSPFVSEISFFAVMEVFVFSIVGLVLRRLRYSLAAFAVGLVLGPTLENNIYLTKNVFPGFTFLERPLADVLFVIAIAILVWRTIQFRKDAKTKKIRDEERLATALASHDTHAAQLVYPYALLGLIATSVLVAIAIPFTIYGAVEYNLATALMPCIAGGLTAAVGLFRIPAEARIYAKYLKAKREERMVAQLDMAMPEPRMELALVGAGVATSVSSRNSGGLVGSVATLESVAVVTQTGGGGPHGSPSDGVSHSGGPSSGPSARGGGPGIIERSWARNGQYTREMAALAWFGGLTLVCYVLGFTPAVVLFCVAYGLFATRAVLPKQWVRVFFAAASAIAMGLVSWELQNLLHVTFTPLIHL